MVRNAGKFGKAKRGGGRHFSRDLAPLDAEGNPIKKTRGGNDSSSSEESSSEESSDDPQSRVGQLPPTTESDEEDDSGLVANMNGSLSIETPSQPSTPLARAGVPKTADEIARARKERKAAAQAGKPAHKLNKDSGTDESEEETNLNANQGKAVKLGSLGQQPQGMSRREKEQADKKAAAERYAKLHAAGKTDEAKSDMARLAEIRRQREQAAARRVAETAAKDAASKAALEKSGKKAPGRR